MDRLVALDQQLTLWVNQHHYPVLDWLVMPVAWLGEAGVGWLVVMLALLIFGGRRERLVTLIYFAGLILTEKLVVPWLRDLWPRPRPYTYLPDVRQLGVRWTSYSFPSAHMHLWMAVAVLYGAMYPRWRGLLIAITVITAYSRPYAGMHHVLDVLAGTALGAVMGALELGVARKLRLTPAPRRAPPAADAAG